MKTLICHRPGDIQYIRRDIPALKENEALLKIKAVGICGTDIHAFAGRQPFFSYPRVLGHEICGEVVSFGNACTTLKTGQRYSVIPCIPCRQCAACREGKTNCCEQVSLYGVHQDGGFSEYLAVREQNLVEVPEQLNDSSAALIECFAIGAHAVRRAEVASGQNVLVIGAGPIGLATAAIARAAGANVVVADIDARRRQHVGDKLGLATIDPTAADFIDQLRQQFSGELACTVLDATGNKGSMSQAVNLIRHGGKIVFIGLYIGELVMDDPTFHKKETTLLSSRNATREDFDRVIALMRAGRFLGTNPIAFGFPVANGHPMIVDMATSATAFGKILHAKETGAPIGEGLAIDKEGHVTTDPNKIENLLPFGGHKGSGIALAIDALTGVLMGGNFSNHIVRMYGDYEKMRKLASLVIVIDPAKLGNTAFPHTMAQMVAELHAVKPAPGVEKVLAPNDPQMIYRQQCRQQGIPVPSRIYQYLCGN